MTCARRYIYRAVLAFTEHRFEAKIDTLLDLLAWCYVEEDGGGNYFKLHMKMVENLR